MRDSHVGAMGVVAIVCVLMTKVAALASLSPEARWRAVLLAPVAGRCALVISVSVLPYARPGGGLATVFYRGRSKAAGLWAALVLGAVGWLGADTAGLNAAALSIGFTLLFAFYTYRKIRGATGDTLGAACEVAELVQPLSLAALPYSG